MCSQGWNSAGLFKTLKLNRLNLWITTSYLNASRYNLVLVVTCWPGKCVLVFES